MRSRKFIVTLLAIISANVMLYLKLIDGVGWSTAVISVCGMYLTANVTQAKALAAAPKVL